MKATVLVQTLSQLPIFTNIDTPVLHKLISNADFISLQSKQHLFHMGESANYFYLVTSGSITLYRPNYAGEHKVFRVVTAGDLLVETSMFLDPPEYPLSAQATGDFSGYRIPGENLVSLCKESPSFSLSMLGGMAERISQSLNRIDLLTISNAAQRLVLYLMDLYQQKSSPWLTLPISQVALARQLNVASETLSRQISSFRRAGLIGGNNPDIVLLDIEELCRVVDLPVPKLSSKQPSAAKQLGTSLFDCCNYASQKKLGRAPI